MREYADVRMKKLKQHITSTLSRCHNVMECDSVTVAYRIHCDNYNSQNLKTATPCHALSRCHNVMVCDSVTVIK
jgi:hypothetical protein